MVAAFGPNTFWEYDTHAACLAEMRYGRATGYERVLYIGIGTGISCAVSIDGDFVRHTFGTCGNTGHIIVSSAAQQKMHLRRDGLPRSHFEWVGTQAGCVERGRARNIALTSGSCYTAEVRSRQLTSRVLPGNETGSR